MARTRKIQRPQKHDPTVLGRAFKRRLKAGDVLLGGIVSEYLRPSLVKKYRYAGFDFIFIEKEHAYFDGSEMTDFVLCARGQSGSRHFQGGRAGPARGRASTRSRCCRHPATPHRIPRGADGPDRLYEVPAGGDTCCSPGLWKCRLRQPQDDKAWLKKANQSTVIMAHIETAMGYENAEEIITTPDLDMVYVGPL